MRSWSCMGYAVPLAVDRGGINHPVVESAVLLADRLGEVVKPHHVLRIEIRPDFPHLDDVGAGAPFHGGCDAWLQVRPGNVIRGYGDAVLAAPLLSDLIEKLLPFRHEVARLKHVQLAILEERGRARGGADLTSRRKNARDRCRRESECGTAPHDAAPGELKPHRFVNEGINTGIAHGFPPRH